MIVCFCLTQIMPVIIYAYITWLNKKRAAKLEALGDSAAYVHNEEFLDQTDCEQVRFVYIK